MEINIQKILCPVDFSDNARHALQYARAFAEAHDAELTLLHVVELTFLPSYSLTEISELNLPVETIQENARQRLEEWVEDCEETCAQVDGLVRVGTPFLEIISCARDEDVDLVVISTHGKTGLKEMLIGSVAERVVRKAPCPVLTVKHPEHEFVKP